MLLDQATIVKKLLQSEKLIYELPLKITRFPGDAETLLKVATSEDPEIVGPIASELVAPVAPVVVTPLAPVPDNLGF